MNNKYLLASLLAIGILNADNEMSNTESHIPTQETKADDFISADDLDVNTLIQNIQNMTPEQREEFEKYIEDLESAYSERLQNKPSNQINVLDKVYPSLTGKKTEEEIFFVEEPTRLLSFKDLVGGVPDSVQLTVKALKKKRALQGKPQEEGQNVKKPKKDASYRLLLYGPPGTGKTTMAEAFARELGAKFMRVKGTAFIDGYIATGTDRIHKLFEKARNLNEQVVVFIDEVDAIGRERTKERNDEYANTLVALLQELDECERTAADRVFVILATNKYATLDGALHSRFSNTALEIKAPSAELGMQIMEYYLSQYEYEPLSRGTRWWMKYWTRGFAGREYENMVNKAALLAGDGIITKANLLKAMNEAYAARKSGEAEKDSWFKKFAEKYSSPWGSNMSAITYTGGAIGVFWGAYLHGKNYFNPGSKYITRDDLNAFAAAMMASMGAGSPPAAS